MAKLTLVIDDWGHKELKEYLTSLNGILDVSVQSEKDLKIHIIYDANFITPRIIKKEIFLFLDIIKRPSFLAFDKHVFIETASYKIICNDLCCEWCFKGAIEDLFEIDGIEKVESNFSESYFLKRYDDRESIIITISYNPNIINIDEMKQIESKLNL